MTDGSDRDPAVVPISIPTRAELWRRNQLARSLLSHRPTAEAVRAALAVLAGEPEQPDGHQPPALP